MKFCNLKVKITLSVDEKEKNNLLKYLKSENIKVYPYYTENFLNKNTKKD